MAFLIDTNIILRLAQLEHPMRFDSLNALTVLKERGEDYYLTSQNLIEYWRTCTRPIENNGLGMTIADAEAALTDLEDVFTILPDTPNIYGYWRRLVVNYEVMGVNVHDARLVYLATDSVFAIPQEFLKKLPTVVVGLKADEENNALSEEILAALPQARRINPGMAGWNKILTDEREDIKSEVQELPKKQTGDKGLDID